jgi:hypothetical protein
MRKTERKESTYIICSSVEFLTPKTQQNEPNNSNGLTEFDLLD